MGTDPNISNRNRIPKVLLDPVIRRELSFRIVPSLLFPNGGLFDKELPTVVRDWLSHIDQVTKLLSKLSDDQLKILGILAGLLVVRYPHENDLFACACEFRIDDRSPEKRSMDYWTNYVKTILAEADETMRTRAEQLIGDRWPLLS